MVDSSRKRATYRDVIGAPSNRVAEIVRGELVLSPRPGGPQAGALAAVLTLVSAPFRFGTAGPGGWIILAEPELHLEAPEEPIVPDIAGWRRERLPAIPDEVAFRVAPNWICEVLSPRTTALDRADKMDVYAGAKVGHAWLIDPVLRTLEVYRLEGAGWVRVHTWKGEARVRAEPFEAVEIDLGMVWAR